MTVEVIQYMRPSGRPNSQATTISDDLSTAYAAMKAAGCNFAAEVLTTGEVSVTIEDRERGEDLDCEYASIVPSVQAGYEAMLRRRFGR